MSFTTAGRDVRRLSNRRQSPAFTCGTRVPVHMTTHVTVRPDLRRALIWSVALAALWVVVALIRPTSTFHLAPFLIAAAPPVLFTMDGDSPTNWATVLRLAAGGMAIALAATLLVAVFGAMQGPAFEWFSGPLVEAVAFTATGTAVGIGFAWWRMR